MGEAINSRVLDEPERSQTSSFPTREIWATSTRPSASPKNARSTSGQFSSSWRGKRNRMTPMLSDFWSTWNDAPRGDEEESIRFD